MKKIPLTQGKFALVDNCDHEYLNQWKWCYAKARSGGYAVRYGGKQLIRMHRVILERMGCKDFITDHISRNKLDNCRCNLRIATVYQNGCNRAKQKNNTSGYIGVYWHKRARKWAAQIKVRGKWKYLGLYDNIKDAARARNKAVLKYHGEFAVLNGV